MAENLSLETLLESQDIGVEILHPGDLAMTDEMARLAGLAAGQRVLDVACGTGESTAWLASEHGCRMVGLDRSASLLARAQRKFRERDLAIPLVQGDAHALPFGDGIFDATISECTLCLLDKERAIAEMVRVTRPGGRVAMHDVCWREPPPAKVARALAEIEGERPETLPGWQRAFEAAGLVDVQHVDRSAVLRDWTRQIRRRLGWRGQARIFWQLLRRGGLRALRNALISERIFLSRWTGYGIVVGRKPDSTA